MRNAAKTLLVAVPSAILGSLLTATLTTTARANPPVAAEQWEYDQLPVPESETRGVRMMNEEGAKGFEAFAVVKDGQTCVTFFKRRR